MTNAQKNELENTASKYWNEALYHFKNRHTTPRYGEVLVLMQDALKYAPTKKSKAFFQAELDRMKNEWNKD